MEQFFKNTILAVQEKKTLRQLIKVKINEDITLTVKSIADFKIWKLVYPNASIVSYNIKPF